MASLPGNSRGLSIVELMVAVVIGMIAILVIMQVAISFESQKRITVGSAGALDEGAVGLFTLRRAIQVAGYGLADPDILTCLVQAHTADPGTPGVAADFAFTLLPLVINQGAGGAPDTITVTRSNSPLLVTAATLIRTYPGSEETNLKLSNRYGFSLGDLVLLANPSVLAPAPPHPAGTRQCAMYEITGLPAGAGETDEVEHEFGNYLNAAGVSVPSRFNRDGGLGIAFPANTTKVFNFGANPVSTQYGIAADNLVFFDQLTGAPVPTILLDGVITLQAQYGFDARPGAQPNMQIPAQGYVVGVGGFSDNVEDADGSGIVGDSGDWLRLGAARIAFVVRSKHPDRPDPNTGLCTATTAPPAWSWGAMPLAVLDPGGTNEWRCFRYRAFEAVIPLRNMFWRAA